MMKRTTRIHGTPRLVYFFKILGILFFAAWLNGSPLAGATAIPFTYEKRVPFVLVQTPNKNQAPMWFILDTGAPKTIIGSTTVNRLKLGSSKSSQPVGEFATAVTCGMGNAPAETIQGLRAICGGLPLNTTSLRADIANLSLSCGRPVDGLLGNDFLKNKILTMNCANRTLHIANTSGTDHAFLQNENDPILVKIATQTSPRPLVFLVDTGTTNSSIDLQVARRMNLSLGAVRNVNVVGGKKVAYTATHFVGTYQGRPLPSQIIAMDLAPVSLSLARPIDGILGMDFMENHLIKIDFHKRQMDILPKPGCQ
ncbi:MAG: pepsin/retropepsin-like aspartic protease family protein [Verrucomicrobia bacterium]|nr:pepsin/retropepsin-like aspartic protease family protein [Verrucomicrobiota bacterium]